MELKVLKLKNPETGQFVIRPRIIVTDEQGKRSLVPVLKGREESNYKRVVMGVLKGEITLDHLTILEHEEYGQYALVSQIDEITSVDQVDESML